MRPVVVPDHAGFPPPHRAPLVLFLALLLCAPFLSARAASGDDLLIADLLLNGQPRGEFFFLMRPEGELLLPLEDFQSLGLFLPAPPQTIDIAREAHVSLNAVPGLRADFDERTLTVILNADPAFLPAVSLNLGPSDRRGVLYPDDNSFFLNYALDYSADGESLDFQRLLLSNEFGLRLGGSLLLGDTIYTRTPNETRFVRLNTALIHDDRPSMRRFTAGDFFASTGDLGAPLHLGGISVAKVYRIDPYFIRYPLFDFSGVVALPSEMELLVDGVRVRRERLDPGAFDLRNFQSIGGARSVEIVITDPFGREERFIAPFYFTDQVLRAGLHEYSYNIGWQRRDFGRESNRYGNLAFAGFHRYGLDDSVNIGGRAEGSAELVNVGAESAFRLNRFGLLRIETAASRHSGGSGWAQLTSYDYTSRTWRGRLAAQSFSRDYRTLADLDALRLRRLNLRAGIGYLDPRFGSFSADYLHSTFYTAQDRSTLTLNWSRRIWPRSYLSVTARRIRENRTDHEASISFSRYLGAGVSASAAYRRERDADVQVLEARQNAPTGLGTGWNVRGERRQRNDDDLYRLQGSVQHNAPLATLRGDYILDDPNGIDRRHLRLSAAGALVHLGGATALTRPVRDSFALVRVGEQKGVGVLTHGQTMARTDSRGLAVIPNLTSYYENQVAIDDRDLPLDYLAPRVRFHLSPPLRSGSCLSFLLTRYQAFSGTLHREGKDGPQPLSHADVVLRTDGGTLRFWTGGEGEFYFDNEQLTGEDGQRQGCADFRLPAGGILQEGTYEVTVRQGLNRFRSEIVLPASAEAFIDLGSVVLPFSSPDGGL